MRACFTPFHRRDIAAVKATASLRVSRSFMLTCFPPFHRSDIAVKATASLRTAVLHADVLPAVSSARYCCQSDREPARRSASCGHVHRCPPAAFIKKKGMPSVAFSDSMPVCKFRNCPRAGLKRSAPARRLFHFILAHGDRIDKQRDRADQQIRRDDII